MSVIKPKVIAFHLPQFHGIPENDQWWGKDFTEWDNVKSGVPLFDGHHQPRIPLHSNYYDLSIQSNMVWQMDLAREYGVYGFCYYHYWFNGKLLLEKPVELIREYQGEKLPYCFCWANEPWTRVWTGDSKTILMNQEYGGQKEWTNHIDYLMRFFEDEAYIKIDNKPVMVIYRTSSIPDCDQMIEYWNLRCTEKGFDGIYVIEEINTFQKEPQCSDSDGVLEFEPLYTVTHKRSILEKLVDKVSTLYINKKNGITCNYHYRYDAVMKNIIKREGNENPKKKRYLGAFPGWDNTPRKKNNGTIYHRSSPEKFQYFLEVQMKKAKELESEFVFVNAWNEWSEGAYLEPDETHQYQYLEAIKRCVTG